MPQGSGRAQQRRRVYAPLEGSMGIVEGKSSWERLLQATAGVHGDAEARRRVAAASALEARGVAAVSRGLALLRAELLDHADALAAVRCVRHVMQLLQAHEPVRARAAA